jgi:hypothetical protein
MMRVDRAVRDLSITPPRIARRERSRLWYRMDPRERAAHLQAGRQLGVAANHETRQAGTNSLRALKAIQKELDQVDHEAQTKLLTSDQKSNIKALTEWRDAPRHCPVVLLCATAELDARLPGPILGPGTRYRIVAQTDGVVMVEVESLDGQFAIGHCKAVDLMSYEPDIMYLREDKRGRRGTTRLGIGKISQRIAGSLIG